MLGKSKDKTNGELIVKETSDQFAIMKMEPGEIQKILKENMGADELTAMDLTRVKVPAAGGTTWRIDDPTEGEIEMKEIVGILVATQVQNAYWEDEYTGGGTPPTCFADDGKVGVGKPGGECQQCDYYQFGSADNKRGKACQQSRIMYVVPQGEILPMAIKAPATSLRSAKQYLLGLVSKRQAMSSVYTKFTLVRDKNQDGIEYSKIVLTKAGEVENPELTRAYSDEIRPYLIRASRTFGMQRDED